VSRGDGARVERGASAEPTLDDLPRSYWYSVSTLSMRSLMVASPVPVQAACAATSVINSVRPTRPVGPYVFVEMTSFIPFAQSAIARASILRAETRRGLSPPPTPASDDGARIICGLGETQAGDETRSAAHPQRSHARRRLPVAWALTQAVTGYCR
jgi:hypothetical protein